ncbi:MAG: EAL domain-containing protein [bacterium]
MPKRFLISYTIIALAISVTLTDSSFLIFSYSLITLVIFYISYYQHSFVRLFENKIVTQEEKIQHQAMHDPLTDLPNWILFKDRLSTELSRAKRMNNSFALFLADLDDFKYVNEKLGYFIGDILIKQIAGRLTGCLREEDTAARLSGDKFLVLTPNCSSAEGAVIIAQKIMKNISGEYKADGKPVSITCSIGIAIYPGDGTTSDMLIKNCESAMHMAKGQRNTYRLYDEKLNRKIKKRIELEKEIKSAVSKSEFFLTYQPKVNNNGNIVSMETLIRWRSPRRGVVGPDEFIPIAENKGYIVNIGYWVLENACRQNKSWQDCGYPEMSVAVNLSPIQFKEERLVDRIKAILNKTGMDPKWLELEITETGIMENTARVKEILQEFHGLGIKNSIDDFGTGYSSLIKLIDLPMDAIKIDKSFIEKITINDQADTITKLTIEMAKQLNMITVAEGVENKNQLDFLNNIGCNQFQGYYFSRPLEAEGFEKLINVPGVSLSPS